MRASVMRASMTGGGGAMPKGPGGFRIGRKLDKKKLTPEARYRLKYHNHLEDLSNYPVRGTKTGPDG